MKRIFQTILLYRLVALTVLVGIVGGILWVFSQNLAVQILFSDFSLVVGAILAWQMLRKFGRGHFGVDILAVIAIVATVAVREYVDSILVKAGRSFPLTGAFFLRVAVLMSPPSQVRACRCGNSKETPFSAV